MNSIDLTWFDRDLIVLSNIHFWFLGVWLEICFEKSFKNE
jgi:hypothetical protein